MRLEKKKEVAAEIARSLGDSGTVYLTDFTGLSVQAITRFRARLREEGIDYRVVKNTLMRRALETLDFPDLETHLDGPTGLILSGDDPVIPAKIVKEFATENDDRPTVKIGIVDRRLVEPAEIRKMADLPSHDELLGSIAGALTASVGGIAGALSALIRDISSMIEQVAEQNGAA